MFRILPFSCPFYRIALQPISRQIRRFEAMSPRKRVAVEVQESSASNGSTINKQKSTATTVVEKKSPKKVIEASNGKDKGRRKAKDAEEKEGEIAEASNGDAAVKSPAKKKAKVEVPQSIAAKVEALADAAESPRKPKRASKKSSEAVDDTPSSLSAPPAGGSKMDTLASPEIPKNLTIDDPLTLDNAPKKPGTTRIMSWNILSLKSSLAKGFTRYLDAEQADVVILTETKVSAIELVWCIPDADNPIPQVQRCSHDACFDCNVSSSDLGDWQDEGVRWDSTPFQGQANQGNSGTGRMG